MSESKGKKRENVMDLVICNNVTILSGHHVHTELVFLRQQLTTDLATMPVLLFKMSYGQIQVVNIHVNKHKS